MKKITFLLIFFSILFQANSQVTIGSGNLEIENAPFEPFFGYSYTQTVYLASEINASGTITDIQWYYSGTTALPNSQSLVIYMAESSRAAYASTTDWEPIASFTQVYSGGITVTAGVAGWVQITLDTPFVYNGTGNLIIAVEDNLANWDASSDDFHNSQVSTNRTISHFSDTVNADPTAPPTASNIDDTIPNVILGGISQACPNPTNVTGTVTVTTVNLDWDAGTGSNWEFINQLAGEPAPTDTDSGSPIATNFVEIMNLTEGSNYEFYVRADCSANGFSSWVGPFLYRISGPGETCENPIVVTNPLPYSTDDDTSNYGDDYSGSPGANCGSTSGYLGGDDVVYSYTPTSDTTITITLTPGGTWSGLFVYDECADIGVNCLAGVANSTSDVREIELAVTAGNTYYIVVSTWPTPQSIPYNLTITENTCTDAVATYTVRQDCLNGPQFFVDVDLTDLGSATSITLTDNQGSTPQTTSATGLFTFGPFANGTGIVVTVANDDDANCTLTSASLTQDQCILNQVDCASGPLNINYCYGDNDDTAWLFQSTDGSPLRITFNAGGIESCCDDILIYDGVDNTGTLLYVGNNGGNLAGLQFDSTGDSLYMEIDADGSVSCQANSFCCTTEWDFTVSCATCVNPVVDYSVRQDCINGPQFFVDVDLTGLGSATSITVSDNQGSTPQTTSATGLFTFGPFTNNTDVVITVANDDDVNCTLTSPSLTQDQCVLNIVDCEVGPLNFNYCYGDNDDATWLFQSSDGSPVRLTFNAGGIESCCDDILIYEGTDNTGTLIYVGNNGGNLAGLQFDSIGDSLFMEIDADGSVSCQAGSGCCTAEWDFTVSCATCVNPAATYTVVDDCDNGDQFLIDVNITSLGDATSLTISNNIDANTVPVTAVGTYQVGPFPFLQNIIITTSNDQDVNCVINSSPIQLLACPPDNDNCDGAIAATVNDNDSCDITTPGTIIAATPSGVPDGCAGDPDDDVWFQFTALNEVQLISITNITGGTTNLDHAVYSGSCGSLTELYCSPDAASITPELVVGNTYYIRVFSFGSVDETSTFDLCIKEAPENTICENASSFCGEGGALYGSNVIGIPNDADVACLGSIPNPSWNILQIGQSGTINIQMVQNTSFDEDGNPTGQGLDVDFVIWGPFDSETDYCALDLLVDCPTCPFSNNPDNGFYPFGNIIDCSYSTAAVENLTIDNAIEGEIYLLLITNFSDDPGTIQIQQTNAGGTDAGAITSEIEVDLGEDQNLCGFTEFELVADSPFADRYEWYEDGFLMEGETASTLTITQSNIYTVIAYDDNCEAVAQDDITINFYLEPTANAVSDIVTCDDASGDNIEDFDLEAQTAGILGAQNPSDFAVTYHLSLADAQNGVGALTSPYNNIINPQTIYVRVEDVDAVGSSSGCFATTSFDLIISGPTPTATSADMELCDDILRDGFESFTLTDNNANILDGQDDTQFTVSYYASEADANAGTGSLTSPYTNLSNPQTVWARVESNVAFDCYSVIDFDLIVLDVPFATFNTDVVDYEVCPDATVPIEISLIPNGYTEADVTVQWTLDTGVIPNQTGLTLPVLVEGIYEATITFNATECSYVVSETVIELESCVIPQGISPNNDGLNDSFDVSSYDVSRLEIFNRNGTLVYSKSNYSNEWFGQTNDGDELPVGTYFYSMIYQGGKEKTGWVYINR